MDNPVSTASPYVSSCPVGCSAPLEDTALRVAEGALRRCTGCGQLLSRASEARYAETMAQFNAADFNAPQGRELARRQTVARQRHGSPRLRAPPVCRYAPDCWRISISLTTASMR
jgi:hypothetical protein